MPPKRKEEKREEDEIVEETGTFVFNNDTARYTGSVLTNRKHPGSNDASAAGGGGATSSSAAPAASKDAMGAAAVAAGAAAAVCVRNGQGVFEDESIRYEGAWKQDTMHGAGVLHFKKSGNVFSGNFINGRYDGRGIMKWASGCRYEGQWRASRMHGDGRYTDATGTVWVGKFYNGVGPGLRPSMPSLLQ